MLFGLYDHDFQRCGAWRIKIWMNGSFFHCQFNSDIISISSELLKVMRFAYPGNLYVTGTVYCFVVKFRAKNAETTQLKIKLPASHQIVMPNLSG